LPTRIGGIPFNRRYYARVTILYVWWTDKTLVGECRAGKHVRSPIIYDIGTAYAAVRPIFIRAFRPTVVRALRPVVFDDESGRPSVGRFFPNVLGRRGLDPAPTLSPLDGRLRRRKRYAVSRCGRVTEQRIFVPSPIGYYLFVEYIYIYI